VTQLLQSLRDEADPEGSAELLGIGCEDDGERTRTRGH
jgi:hypothetical protein